MEDFEKLTNKKFAYACLDLLKKKGRLNEPEIRILTNEDQCKKLFCCSKFPVLSEVTINDSLADADCYDDYGRQRYYKEKIEAEGRAFVVSNHWYGPGKSMSDNRTPFLQ